MDQWLVVKFSRLGGGRRIFMKPLVGSSNTKLSCINRVFKTTEVSEVKPSESQKVTYDAQGYYSDCLKRVSHEYDQRDRDFLMHTTVTVALFAGIGFLTNMLKRDIPMTWAVVGLSILFVSYIGLKSSEALCDSVRSFRYWQEFIEKHLADVESKFLPPDFDGLYKSALNSVGQPKNVTQARQAMANTLRLVWRIIAFMSFVLVMLGVAPVFCPALKIFIITLHASL